MSFSVVFLSQGKIRLLSAEGKVSTIESRFGTDLRAKLLRAQEKNAWKGAGNAGSLFSGAAVWGGNAGGEAKAIPIYITSLARGHDAGQFLYSMESDSMGAVLRVDRSADDELRLWTNNQQRVERKAEHPGGHIAGSVRNKSGSANLGIRLAETAGFSEVTEGDSIDTSPSWIPGDGLRLVFQSAGLGRRPEGHVQGLGPFGIQTIDVDKGEMATLLEEPDHDLLTPKMDGDGNLWFIRRPYSGLRRTSFLGLLKDIVMFPIRMVSAVFGFLDIFAKIFSGKGLKSAGGPARENPSLRQLVIWGNLVNAAPTNPQNDAPDLVPNTWQLIRRSASGSEEVVARGVLSFDLLPDGGVLFTNGSAITLRNPDGTTKRIFKEALIEQLVALPM